MSPFTDTVIGGTWLIAAVEATQFVMARIRHTRPQLVRMVMYLVTGIYFEVMGAVIVSQHTQQSSISSHASAMTGGYCLARAINAWWRRNGRRTFKRIGAKARALRQKLVESMPTVKPAIRPVPA